MKRETAIATPFICIFLHAACMAGPDVVKVSDFGFDAEDSTRFLQAALDSGAPFNVMVSGESTAERVGAELFSPSGTRVWHEPAALWWHGWRGRGTVEEGLWKLRVSRPSKDRMEDFHVDATGIPGTLFLSSKKYW